MERRPHPNLRYLKAAMAAALAVMPTWTAAQQAREMPPAPIRGELPEHLRQYRERGLPPVGDRIEFENLEAFPPRIKGREVDPGFRLDVKPGPKPPMRETRAKMRETALADARVRKILGDRFSLLGSGWLEADKNRGTNATSDRYRLVFYSYRRNVAVNVIVERDKVVEIRPDKTGYQPAESHEEVEAAADLVRQDKRYRTLAEGRVARGIEASPGKDGHRHLYVTFHEQKRTPALAEATVDMTSGRVVSARRLQR